MRQLAFVAAALLLACTSEATGPDEGRPLFTPDPPDSPVFTPCPSGWREVERAGVAVCDPSPEAGVATCAPHEAHFPGGAGCTGVGTACPEGDFAEVPPGEGPVAHVLAGTAGGDGSVGAPFGTIAEALGALGAGGVVLVGPGTYDGAITLSAGTTLVGACAAETVLTTSSPEAEAVVTVEGAAVELLGVRIAAAESPGIAVAEGGALHLRGVVVDGVTAVGVLVAGDLTGEALVVRGVRAAAEGGGGHGLSLLEGGTAVITAAVFEGNREVGVLVDGSTTRAVLSDVAIRDTHPEEVTGRLGHGLSVAGGASVELTRALLEHNHAFHVRGRDSVTHLTLTDVVLRDGDAGRGMSLEFGATADVTRALLERNQDHALFVAGTGAAAYITDLVVRETASVGGAGVFGRGLGAQDGAVVTVTRGVFEGNREAAVAAFAAHTDVRLSHVLVRETMPRDCASTTCADAPAGHGMGSYAGATLSVADFVVADASLCGVQMAAGGGVDLFRGVVSGSPVGACVPDESYDIERLTNGVDFLDNGADVEVVGLPAPEPVARR